MQPISKKYVGMNYCYLAYQPSAYPKEPSLTFSLRSSAIFMLSCDLTDAIQGHFPVAFCLATLQICLVVPSLAVNTPAGQ
jgi:thiosulfate reductase cytochrome b subunit